MWHSGVLRSSICCGTALAHENSPRILHSRTPDNSAAKEIANREGVGRVRSLESRVLWLQQAVRRGLIELGTVPSEDNLADLVTKALRVDSLEKLRNGCSIDLEV